MTFFYPHRSVSYPVIIGEASSGRSWKQMQRPTVRHYVGIMGYLHQIPPPSELREPGGRGARRSIRARGDGRH